ncbi:hypothetical protein K490DRAFT_63296 [Saccharata proteae CBS 121410]|uniref:WAP domain-containing protein n=1 Tax=Saccharata proteae CBS 121410 TaxID=1314787 RepID=A0A9P4LYX2_9PEZI|nr:hypothetical protein K490DRAFT_63296 [Saccharata proteae CBS 121410]
MLYLTSILSVLVLVTHLLALAAASDTAPSSPSSPSPSSESSSPALDTPELLDPALLLRNVPNLIDDAEEQSCGPEGVDCGGGWCCSKGQSCRAETLEGGRVVVECVLEKGRGGVESILSLMTTRGDEWGGAEMARWTARAGPVGFLKPTGAGGVGDVRTTVVTMADLPGVTDWIVERAEDGGTGTGGFRVSGKGSGADVKKETDA